MLQVLIFLAGQAVAVGAVFLATVGLSDLARGLAFVFLATAEGVLLMLLRRQGGQTWSRPLQAVSADIRKIADGAFDHRIGEVEHPDFHEIREGVNRLADRLIDDQRLLAENVASLDSTNRELLLAQDQVVRSARLASVGTLSAGIAHEVGNPLGAIMGFVDVAKERAQADGASVELLDAIRDEARRIDRIIKGLLDYGRPPAEGADPVPVQDVLARVERLLTDQGRLGGVATEWDAGSAAGILIEEPHRLEQVLVNLILNALHAVAHVRGPRIEVRASERVGEVTSLPRKRESDPPGVNYSHRRRTGPGDVGPNRISLADRVLAIEVFDNGPGISEAVAGQLFDPFFTTKEPGEGTGLGLSICARLMESMGGRIDAELDREGGACFLVRLPVTREAEAEVSESADSETVAEE